MVLAFACTWALPLLTSLVAGDVFAAEDRLGTWQHLLVAVRSTPTDLRREGAGQPRRDPAARRRRWPPRASPAGSPRSAAGPWSASTATSSRPAQARGHGPARLGLRAGADAGVRGGRPARLGRPGPLPDGVADARTPRPRCCSSRRCCRCPSSSASPCRARDSSPGAGSSPAPRRPGRWSSAWWSASPGRPPRARWPTCCSCAATSPTRRTTGRGDASSSPRRSRWPPSSPRRSRWSPPRPRPAGPASTAPSCRAPSRPSFAHLYRLQTEELHRPAVTEDAAAHQGRLRQGRRPRRGPRDRATTGAAS